MDFERLFTIGAFEGLRLIRQVLTDSPEATEQQAYDAVCRRGSQATGADLEAALVLHRMVNAAAPIDSVEFYRECVASVMVAELPNWAKVMTLGRGRFIKSLKGDDYRDIVSVFRESRLLDDPPTIDDIKWWDDLTSRVRFDRNQELGERSRLAEQLTMEYETKLLGNLGINDLPKWMAIEDNTLGYDVLSYRKAHESVRNLLIEVKSTIASPERFIVSRNEWRVADEAGDAYLFHIWDMKQEPPNLHVRTVDQVRTQIPQDNDRGKWKDAEIYV